MDRSATFPDFLKEPTPEELAERKRIEDRRVLLDHVDYLLRPPPWVYREIEDAIELMIADRPTEKIESRDGCLFTAGELFERWELEKMLEVYRQPVDDPAYETAW